MRILTDGSIDAKLGHRFMVSICLRIQIHNSYLFISKLCFVKGVGHGFDIFCLNQFLIKRDEHAVLTLFFFYVAKK